jgi:transcriptional regulator with XRE-family HTH domain
MPESRPPEYIFPERLKKARELRGLGQPDVAKRSGIQSSAISHFETGNRKPSFDNLRRLAQALDVTTDFLMGRTDEIGGTATADRLYRNIQQLQTGDREFIEDWIKSKADRARDKERKYKERKSDK